MQVLQCHLRGKAGFLRCNKSRLEFEIDRLRANKHIYTHLPQLSRVIRKPDFCICENNDADLLHSDRAADQCLCFRNIDSAIPIRNLQLQAVYSPVCVQPGRYKRQVISRRG